MNFKRLSRFRLVATLDEQTRSFPLQRGRHVIGTLAECYPRLELPGISRRHAELQVGENGLSITDLGSKNGTVINGRAVRSARLEVGDHIDLCEVRLVVEPLDAAESALAVSLTGPSTPVAEGLDKTTQARRGAVTDPAAVAEGLGTARRLWRRLFAAGEPDLEAAVAILVEATGSRGMVALERRGASCVVLSSHGCGEADLAWAMDAVAAAPATAPATEPAAEPAAEPRTLRRAATGEVEVALALFDPHPGPAAPALLELAADWLLHISVPLARESAPPPRPEPEDELVFPPGYIRGTSPAMRSVYSQLRHLKTGTLPVLIIGDTGVGKELVARTLHLSSPRRDGPMVAINCAAIPAELLEAELFGIGRGVATGVTARAGRIAEADGGTLFLDEVGDMPSSLQAKLLRVLQEREIQPLGGAPRQVDVRIVSATHAGLAEAIERGDFRQDLYYRLAGYVLRLPPLAERTEDLPVLVEHFLRRFCRDAEKPIQGVTVAALRRMAAYPWPGNVRQLEHEVRRMVYLAYPGQAIDTTLLSPELGGDPPEAAGAAGGEGDRDGDAGPRGVSAFELPTLELAALEKMAIEAALESSDGTLIDAANRLGLTRDSLRRRLIRHGLRES